MLRKQILTYVALTQVCLFAFSSVAWTEEDETPPMEKTSSIETDHPQKVETSTYSGPTRNFYQVLDEVLLEFEFDIKNGNIFGLKDLAIRNIVVSENIPASFKDHLEFLITEKIMQNSKAKIIQCLQCHSRNASLNGDQVIISSPEASTVEMSRVAKASGIQHFMDIAFSFQPSGIVLSMYIADADTGSITWSHSYNSETSRSSAYRRGVDFSQIDEAHKQMEYSPTIQSRFIIYYFIEPSISTTEGCLSLGYRMMERYGNRKREVGFEIDYLANASTIVNSSSATSQSLYRSFGLNLTLLFLHAWNFIGDEENYNRIRPSFFLGIGGTYTSGFLGGLARVGFEERLGKHFSISLSVGYRPQASAFQSGSTQGTVSGLEYGLGVNILF